MPRLPMGGTNLLAARGPTLCVGAGKAAARMAAGCEDALGTERVRGLVIVPDGCDVPLSTVTVAQAGHPIPDFRGANAHRPRVSPDRLRPDRAGALV